MYFILIVQAAFASVIFTSVCSYIYLKCGKALFLFSVLFYSLTPIWWAFLQTAVKDIPFFLSFTLFFLQLVKLYYGDGTRLVYVNLSITALICCMFRYGGLLIFIPTFLGLYLISVDSRNRILYCLLSVAIGNFIVNSLIPSFYNLHYNDPKEMLSIPIQQLARTVKYKGGALSESDKETLGIIFKLPGLPEDYNPENSDPMRGSKHLKNLNRLTAQEKRSIALLWFTFLKKYPRIYFEATFNNVSGYLCPFYYTRSPSGYLFGISNRLKISTDSGTILTEYLFPSNIRSVLANEITLWRKVPFLSFAVNPGAYSCLLLFCAFNLYRKRERREILLYVPVIAILLICIASPVNGYMRYFLPIASTMPLWSFVGLKSQCLISKRPNCHSL